ncbi:MAG: hypothetical protein N2489_10985 [Clostridia bacterium]|nr:hypothetical protein [Clostridia bacterium]
MEYTKYRRHPRVYKKQAEENNENTLTLTAAAAAGILALSFAKGMFWGYMIKKWRG